MDISSFLAACETASDIHMTHFLCVSGEEVLAQFVKPPYRMDTLRLCFSMTKSFASLAIGIAWGQGLVDLNARVSDILPECMPESGNALKVRVCDLLTMSGGVHDNNYGTMIETEDWVRAYFKQDFPHEPGSYYLYCTHGSHVLSAIIERVYGLSLEDFLNQYLFHPMDIYEAQWEHDQQGRTAGGMGLSLYPTSLAKIAMLLLNGGRYSGAQLIPEHYVHMAGAVQIRKQDHKAEEVYGGDGYGFQFHVGKDGYYRMDGAFGQVCLICPERDRAFIVLSSGAKTETLLRLIYTHFIDQDAMAVEMSAQAVHGEKEWADSGFASKCYILSENPMQIRSVRLDREKAEFSLVLDDREWRISFDPNKEVCGRSLFIKDLEEREQRYVCTSTENNSMLELVVHYIETPYITAYRLEKTEAGARFRFRINCSFTLKDFCTEIK